MASGEYGPTADDVGGNRVTAYARWVIRWRWLVIAASLLAAVMLATGGQYLGFSTNYRVFFSEQNPQLQAFDALQRIYIRDDNISIVIHPAEGEVFTPELLLSIREMTEAAWLVPYTTRVDSITNFQNSTAEDDDLTVEDLVGEDSPLDAADLARIRMAALAEPLILHRLISKDARTTSVNITVTLRSSREIGQ